jgi:flavoprotein
MCTFANFCSECAKKCPEEKLHESKKYVLYNTYMKFTDLKKITNKLSTSIYALHQNYCPFHFVR